MYRQIDYDRSIPFFYWSIFRCFSIELVFSWNMTSREFWSSSTKCCCLEHDQNFVGVWITIGFRNDLSRRIWSEMNRFVIYFRDSVMIRLVYSFRSQCIQNAQLCVNWFFWHISLLPATLDRSLSNLRGIGYFNSVEKEFIWIFLSVW